MTDENPQDPITPLPDFPTEDPQTIAYRELREEKVGHTTDRHPTCNCDPSLTCNLHGATPGRASEGPQMKLSTLAMMLNEVLAEQGDMEVRTALERDAAAPSVPVGGVWVLHEHGGEPLMLLAVEGVSLSRQKQAQP